MVLGLAGHGAAGSSLPWVLPARDGEGAWVGGKASFESLLVHWPGGRAIFAVDVPQQAVVLHQGSPVLIVLVHQSALNELIAQQAVVVRLLQRVEEQLLGRGRGIHIYADGSRRIMVSMPDALKPM